MKKIMNTNSNCSIITPSIQCELKKKGNPDLISNLWKTKRRITKLILGNDSTIIPLSLWHISHAYWITDDCSAIIFVKTCQNYFFPNFE